MMHKWMRLTAIIIYVLCLSGRCHSAEDNNKADKLPDKIANKPLFRDPVYDGATDPVVCWNNQEQKWFMFYTSRRANVSNLKGVSWVHGSKIGIAESSDGGATWKYRGTAMIDYGQGEFSYWAPEILYHNGTYHMYLSFVPGMHTDWSGTRDILHLTSTDMLEWKYQSTLKLSSDRVIDACVLRMPDGTWRMWYNNETDHKSIYYADSPDLYTWKDGGKVIGDQPGEGPNVFQWKNKYWMIVDVWDGQGVYSSDDAVNWTRQKENLLQKGGTGPDDTTRGHHADVVVSSNRAYLFYFTHPGTAGQGAKKDGIEQRRSSVQVVELEYKDGRLICDRDKPVNINLIAPTEENTKEKAATTTKEYNACDNGAKGDSTAVCTEAIQKTIDRCFSAGGGTVVFSPGVYMTGSIFLKDKVNLRVDEGVTLKGVLDDAAYPLVFTRVAGIEMQWPAALINAHNLKDVKIYGKGVIDGSGKQWWDRYWKMNKEYSAKGLRWVVDYDCKRPRLMLIYKSSGVTVEGLTLREPGFWTVHICYSDHITVDGVKIQANRENQFGPSSDGIDIDSSSDILVQNCDIDCNDDNFCLKAGRDADGLRVNRPTENVVIRNCIARRGAGLITFGSETSGGISKVEVYNLKAHGTDTGIRFKSTQGRGGTVSDINIHDIQMQDVAKVVELNYDWYPAYNTVPENVRKQIKAEGKPLGPHWVVLMQQVPEKEGTPYIRDITIRNVKAAHCGTAFTVEGRENQKAGNFIFENVSIQAQKSGSIKNAENWVFKDVTVQAADGTTVQTENCVNMQGL
jgi:polygalacturonase